MKSMQLYIVFALSSISLVRAHFKVVYCYQCEDCDELNDCLLQPCPLILPTTTSTTTTTTTTTHIESTSTRPTTPMPIFPTHIPTYSTSIATSDSPSETTDNIETSETPENTEIPDNPDTPETTEETTEEQSTEDPETLTHKRSDRSLTTDHSYKSVLVYPAAVSHHCFKVDIIQNNRRKTNRGCVEVPEYLSGCGVLRSKYGCSIKSCKVCSVDGCNNSADFRYSVIVLVISVVLSLVFERNGRI